MSKLLSFAVAVGVALASLAVFVPTSAEAQVRTEKRPNIALIVGGVAAGVLAIVLATAGGGGDGNQRPPVSI